MAAPEWAVLHGIADRRTSAFKRAFVEAVAQATDAMSRGALETAIRQGRYDQAYTIAIRAWEAGAPLWRQKVAGQLRSVFQSGGQAASLTLHTRFDLINPRAVEWVQQHAALLVTRVSDTVRASIRQVIQESISGQFSVKESARLIRTLGIGLTDGQAMAVINLRFKLLAKGVTPDQVAARAERYRGQLLRQRAETIARTETINGANAGQLEAWRQAQAKGLIRIGAQKRWLVTPDDRLCPRCRAMSGQTKPLGDPFVSPEGALLQGPTLHPNCLPGHVMVTAAAGITAFTERRYDGDLLIIRTASGQQFSCTPNHPVLTAVGWLPAQFVYVGCDVIGHAAGQWRLTRDQKHEHVPARIEDMAEAFRRSQQVSARPVPVSAEDFHGDGRGSEVAIVWTDGLLRDGDYPADREEFGEEFLAGTDMQGSLLDSSGALQLLRQRHYARFGRAVGCGHLMRSSDDIHAGPFHELRVGLPAQRYASSFQPSIDGASVNAVGAGQAVDGFAGEVSAGEFGDIDLVFPFGPRPPRYAGVLQPSDDDNGRDAVLARQLWSGDAGQVFSDNVVRIDVASFHGHVFNLETDSGAFAAEGIVTHNCRCAVKLIPGRAVSRGRAA